MFELYKYGSQIIDKLTKGGLLVIFKLGKLRSALIEHFSIHKNTKFYIKRPARFTRRPISTLRLLYQFSILLLTKKSRMAQADSFEFYFFITCL